MQTRTNYENGCNVSKTWRSPQNIISFVSYVKVKFVRRLIRLLLLSLISFLPVFQKLSGIAESYKDFKYYSSDWIEICCHSQNFTHFKSTLKKSSLWLINDMNFLMMRSKYPTVSQILIFRLFFTIFYNLC